jgi:glycosyltransferase involved in cell wall biosynthesis
MRIVVVGDRFATTPGGIEAHAEGLARKLLAAGHEVRWVRPGWWGISSMLRGPDLLVFEGVRRAALLRYRCSAVGRHAPAVLFTHGSFYEFLHGAELIEDGLHEGRVRRALKRTFDRLFMTGILARMRCILTLSGRESEELRRLFGDVRSPIIVSPNWVDLEPPFRPAPHLAEWGLAPGSYVCAVSRIEARKNLSCVIAAVRPLHIPFALAGSDFGDLAALERAAAATEVVFRYLGRIGEREKAELIGSALAVVIPSYLEGVPILALEALHLGTPVICTSRSYLDPGEGVVLIPPTSAALRAAINTVRSWPARPAPRKSPSPSEVVETLRSWAGIPS